MFPQDAFQHYCILRREDGSLHELGRGTMGVTFKAFDTNLRVPVALKVVNGMFLHHEAARARFLREARAAAALRHRNVATVHHLCGEGDHYFYAMEFIDGETVEDWVRRIGRLPVETALRVVLQVARALGAAHKQNLVHRDVKPANIMVVSEDEEDDDEEGGEQFLVKLIDFGLARAFHRGSDTLTSPPGTTTPTFAGFVGTPAYSSPEQLEERELDTRSDVYSLGATLWFMLTGRTPFTGTMSQIYQQHVAHEIPWDHLAAEPRPVVHLLRQLLQKDPDQRPQNPAELRRRVAECLRALKAGSSAGGGTTDEGDATFSDGTDGGLTVLFSRTVDLPEPVPGLTLANGLRLGPLVGEGRRGLVFQGEDPRREGRRVAVKVFHHDQHGGSAGETEFARRRELAGRVRVTPHPHLLEVLTLERHRHFHYLVTEWVNGFTLVSLLSKRGALSVSECLRLLRQVAEAAGHARVHGLTGLELAPHQIMVHFPAEPGVEDGFAPVDQAILRAPLTEWPAFALKVDVTGDPQTAGGAGLATWPGGITRVPTARGRTETGESGHKGPDLRALGILVYELLGGGGSAPLVRLGDAAAVVGGSGGDDREARPPMLPSLGEEGNAVLQRALSAAPGFADEGEFYAALARATGFDPETLRPSRPHAFGTTPGTTTTRTTAPAPMPLVAVPSLPVVALPLPAAAGSVRMGESGIGRSPSRLRRWTADPLAARMGAGLRRAASRGGRPLAGGALLGLAGLVGWAVARHGAGPAAGTLPPAETTVRAPAPTEVPPPVLPSAGRRTAVDDPAHELAGRIVVMDPAPWAPAGSSNGPAGGTTLSLSPAPPMAGPVGVPEPGITSTGLPNSPAPPPGAGASGPGVVTSNTAAAAAAAASPSAADDDEEEPPDAKKGGSRKRTAARSSSRTRRRRTPHPEPNFFQRMFHFVPPR